MDDRMNNSLYRKKAKCKEAIQNIITAMKKYQVPIPSIYQRSRVHEDLPKTPERKEAEILRRFKYLQPENNTQIAQKLNDLLVYAVAAQEIRSELIAIIVLSKLRKWEEQLLDPEQKWPPLATASPATRAEQLQRQKLIDERDRQIAHAIRQYEEEGQNLLESVQSRGSPKFGDNARTIKLPKQTLVTLTLPLTWDEYCQQQQKIEQRDRKATEAVRHYEDQGRQRAASVRPPEFGDNARRIILPQQTIEPTRPPTTLDEHLERQLTIEERDRRNAEMIREYEEFGRQRAASARPPEFGDNARRIILPQQTIEPTRPPTTFDEHLERQRIIEERDRRNVEMIRNYEEHGRQRAASARPPEFGDNARRILLPQQTIAPTRPPATFDEYLERQLTIEDRDRRNLQMIRNYEEQGRQRAAASARPPEFGDNARRIILPQQTIASPHKQMAGVETPTVDLEEQRRRDLEQYKKFGAVRKRLHERPDFDRDLGGPKLPPHGLNPPSTPGGPLRQYKELEKQRELDSLERLLREALVSRRIKANRANRNNANNNDDDNDNVPTV